ncbi:MAG: Mov34/MPN/PAD-1 family protein, partial [Candidatus Binatia bacterium]
TAYFMEPKELLGVLKEVDEQKHALLAFYHSHPEHGAYFSDEDKARAMAWDEPAYPDACYLVVSVKRGAVGERLAVAWDTRERDWKAVDLVVK